MDGNAGNAHEMGLFEHLSELRAVLFHSLIAVFVASVVSWFFSERAVDLLIRPQELTRAIAALEALGFELPPEPTRTHYLRSSHHLPMKSPGPVSVDFEIHWNLAQEGRYKIDPDRLFERARPLDVAGRPVLPSGQRGTMKSMALAVVAVVMAACGPSTFTTGDGGGDADDGTCMEGANRCSGTVS